MGLFVGLLLRLCPRGKNAILEGPLKGEPFVGELQFYLSCSLLLCCCWRTGDPVDINFYYENILAYYLCTIFLSLNI